MTVQLRFSYIYIK